MKKIRLDTYIAPIILHGVLTEYRHDLHKEVIEPTPYMHASEGIRTPVRQSTSSFDRTIAPAIGSRGWVVHA